MIAAPAAADEQPLQFVHVLQKNGYGDMAVQYLEILAKRPDLPPKSATCGTWRCRRA